MSLTTDSASFLFIGINFFALPYLYYPPTLPSILMFFPFGFVWFSLINKLYGFSHFIFYLTAFFGRCFSNFLLLVVIHKSLTLIVSVN